MKQVVFLLLFLNSIFALSQNSEAVAYPEVTKHPKIRTSKTSPSKSFLLSDKIPEGSGIVAWDGLLWTHNDSGEAKLFALDTTDGKIVKEYELKALKNRDWEDLEHDNNYFYIGDFGNNSGNRESLHIFRISKSSLATNKPVIDTITFNWAIVGKADNAKVNYDCEAMAIVGDSIYLFTKEWKRKRCTKVFSLPVEPGKYTARYQCTLKTDILITGASYNKEHRQLVLCGYTLQLDPSLLVFPQVTGTDFFAGKGKRIRIKKAFDQLEGITTFDGTRYYLINEETKMMFLHRKQGIDVVTVAP